MSTQTEANVINDLSGTEPVPAMPMPLSTKVTLLRGLGQKQDDGTDVWHEVAEVRELTGADEEALATIETKEGVTYTEYMNALLERAVISIGSLKVADLPGIVNKLILADRDMLFLGIVRATYGNTREMQVVCPKCRTMNDVEIDLDEDFKVEKPSFDLRQDIEVQTKKAGLVRLRLPTGEDTIQAQKKATTDAELNTVMLSRCAMWYENEPKDRIAWARNLNVADRRKLVNTLLDIKVGPEMEGVDTQCDACGAEMPILLDWVSLLLR